MAVGQKKTGDAGVSRHDGKTNDNRVTVTVTVQAGPSRELPAWAWVVLAGLALVVLAAPHLPPAAGQALAHVLGQLADHAPR